MAEYKGIKGFKVQSLDADPVPAVAGWTSGGNQTSFRTMQAGAGTQTAAVAFGGYSFTTSTNFNTTEEYDGATWTSSGTLGTARREMGGAGTQTAALGFGGRVPPDQALTEEYNGSTWTSGGSLGTARAYMGDAGTQTAALGFGGESPAGVLTSTEEYDGATWTSSGAMPVAKYSMGSCGTQTAALSGGGANPITAITMEYNGATWTTNPATMNSARYGIGAAGTQTAALFFGGEPQPPGNEVESWDGTSWSNNPATLTSSGGGFTYGVGTNTLALSFSGSQGYLSGATEEYTDYSPYTGQTVENVGQVWYNTTTKALKYTSQTAVGTWATAANIPSAGNNGMGGAGTLTAGLAMGGYALSSSSEYDGAAWTAGGTIPGTTPVGWSGGTSGGTQTAAVIAGGSLSPSSPYNGSGTTWNYDGSTWTTSGSLVWINRGMQGGSGTQTAMLSGTGYNDYAPQPSYPTNSQSYDGSVWTTSASLPTNYVRYNQFGTYSAAGLATGSKNPSPGSAFSDFNTFNGTAWTAGNPTVSNRQSGNGVGTLSAATLTGGYSDPSTAISTMEEYDGTSWANGPSNIPTHISEGGSIGSASVSIYYGGQTPGTLTVQEYTKGYVNNIQTVTVS